jgi:IS4 transposase
MTKPNTFSLSLQKQFENKRIIDDCELNQTFTDLKFGSLVRRSNIVKKRGRDTLTLLFAFVLLPFLKRSLTGFWNCRYLHNYVQAHKDTFYRFLNNECFNWRKLVYLVALKAIAMGGDVPLKEKVLIADDSICPKSGKAIELVSYHFDHKVRRSILGNQYLQLGFHNGLNFFPLDGTFHTSSHRPNTHVREIDKRTNGWKRRTEALRKKTDVLVQMIDRAWKSGIDASFVLFDSWFSHDDIIRRIVDVGYGVICRLKRNRVRYGYQGKDYTLKQLWQQFAKKNTAWIKDRTIKGVCLNVTLKKTGPVRVLFVSDGRKQWQAILCTDTELEPSRILEYYARRWSIEVYFKDAKQMLYMGKEQSNTFDALVASQSLVMIRYLILVYIQIKRRLNTSVGPLFRQVSDDQSIWMFSRTIWTHVKELIAKSSDVLSYRIEPDLMFHFIDIIEDLIVNQARMATAKL